MSEAIMSSTELAVTEITDLHAFFQSWFRGEIAATESVFSRVEAVWGPSFELIGPDSLLRDASEVVRTTFDEHGRYPDLLIRIKNLVVREIASGSAVIARYEEWHTDGETVDPRLCSAILIRPDPRREQMLWLHIHESDLRLT